MFCNSCTSGPLEHAYDSASKIPMAIFFGLTVLATIGLAGCSDKPVEIKAIDPAASQTASKEESRRKLGSAIQRIQPESMAIQSRRELVVNGLNSWLATSAEGDVEKLKIATPTDRDSALQCCERRVLCGSVRTILSTSAIVCC